jgi:hypothetical protein
LYNGNIIYLTKASMHFTVCENSLTENQCVAAAIAGVKRQLASAWRRNWRCSTAAACGWHQPRRRSQRCGGEIGQQPPGPTRAAGGGGSGWRQLRRLMSAVATLAGWLAAAPAAGELKLKRWRWLAEAAAGSSQWLSWRQYHCWQPIIKSVAIQPVAKNRRTILKAWQNQAYQA